MSCSDFSIDSLEILEFPNSNDKVKYVKENTALNTEWQLFESLDLMSVPLYSGPVSLKELKKIEVNGDKILELETKELSNINKKKYLSNIEKSMLKNLKHPRKQGKKYNLRELMNIEKIDQIKPTSNKEIETTNKESKKN